MRLNQKNGVEICRELHLYAIVGDKTMTHF